MLYDPADAPHLKSWLVRGLEPICDAEPGALADYIQALLKHNVPEQEMRKELESQLEEFLEKECAAFLDSLFSVLRTKSYLPYSTSTPTYLQSASGSMDNGIPIPLDDLIPQTSTSSGRKRSLDNDEHDNRPSKGPRLSFDSNMPYGRVTEGPDNWVGNGRRHMNDDRSDSMGYQNTGGRTMQYRPPDQRRGVCRDYYNNGYCSRGAFCKYSHGNDAVVPNQLFQMPQIPPNIMPFLLQNGGMPFGGTYDPHEARMDMNPRRAPIMSRAQQAQGNGLQNTSGELPVIQDLTPATTEEGKPPTIPPHRPLAVHNDVNNLPTAVHQIPHIDVSNRMDVDQPVHGGGRGRGGFRGRGRGGGGTFRPELRTDKTLVVEKIPVEKLSLEEVNNWFKKFGTVTNVAIDAVTGKALVSFSDHSEARAAWKSEDAVFGNRFVKVFWHRPMEGHGQTGARMLAASAPLVANISAREAQPSIPAPKPPAAPTPTPRVNSAQATAANALAEKQRLLEQRIAEQKSLMNSLSTATAEEKKQIMIRLRQLGEEMKSSPSTPEMNGQSPPVQQSEKERLDKELEIHHAVSGGGEGEETAEELKAKLEKLKAEAASLGISETGNDYQTSTYRGYRGRGRGRGTRPFYGGRGRGGPPRASMKLDNRPKKLVVKGASADGLQAVRDWYETTGQMESADIQEGGDILVAFRSRAAAEQGLAKGQNIPIVGTVQVTWFSEQPIPKIAVAQPSESSPTKAVPNGHVPTSEAVPSPRVSMSHGLDDDEEMLAGGWGGDDIGM